MKDRQYLCSSIPVKLPEGEGRYGRKVSAATSGLTELELPEDKEITSTEALMPPAIEIGQVCWV